MAPEGAPADADFLKTDAVGRQRDGAGDATRVMGANDADRAGSLDAARARKKEQEQGGKGGIVNQTDRKSAGAGDRGCACLLRAGGPAAFHGARMLDRPAEAGPSPPSRDRTIGVIADGNKGERPWPGLAPIIAVLRRRRWVLILSILITPALAFVALRQMTPRYTGVGTLIYDPSEFAARELQSILRLDPTTDAVMASQAEITRSLPIAERVAERFDLAKSPEFNWRLRPPSLVRRIREAVGAAARAVFGGEPAPAREISDEELRHAVTQSVQNAITVRNIKSTRVLEISFTTEDQALAAAAVNFVMDTYISDQLDGKFNAVAARERMAARPGRRPQARGAGRRGQDCRLSRRAGARAGGAGRDRHRADQPA